MDNPTHTVYNKRVHEWRIATPCDAKTLRISMTAVEHSMKDLGVDITWDDAYSVLSGDNEIIFRVEWTD